MNKSDIEINKSKALSSRKIFVRGLISNTLNPKIAVFFLAFLPQFINTGSSSQESPVAFIILGSVFALCGLLFLSLLGYFSGAFGHYIKTKKSISVWIKNISGGILILLGIKLAIANQD